MLFPYIDFHQNVVDQAVFKTSAFQSILTSKTVLLLEQLHYGLS